MSAGAFAVLDLHTRINHQFIPNVAYRWFVGKDWHDEMPLLADVIAAADYYGGKEKWERSRGTAGKTTLEGGRQAEKKY